MLLPVSFREPDAYPSFFRFRLSFDRKSLTALNSLALRTGSSFKLLSMISIYCRLI